MGRIQSDVHLRVQEFHPFLGKQYTKFDCLPIMDFILCAAVATDAPSIARIHMAAFKTNASLHAFFPTPATRAGLQIAVETKTLSDLRDPEQTVLVMRNRTTSEVVAFAKWHVYKKAEICKDHNEGAWVWPQGSNQALLGEWAQLVQSARDRHMDGRDYLCK
jgi:hypothetical protein